MSAEPRILIVDDEPNVRFVFRTTLESAGYHVDEAADGRLALEHLEQHATSLVLLDLQMPDVDGMEVLRRLRDAGSDVPVVIVTAHGSVPDAVAAMKLGAIDFLSKPITPEALRAVVSDVLGRHGASHPAVVVVSGPMLNLAKAKQAINHRDLDRAAMLLEEALDAAPESLEAQTLLGVLYECRGQHHAAYQAYRAVLKVDPHHHAAAVNLTRYCEKYGLDVNNPQVNPAAVV